MARFARIAELFGSAGQAGDLQQQVQAFVAEARQIAAGGLTLAEAGQLFTTLITLAVAGAASLANPGADKKAMVLAAVGFLYDNIAPAIPLPFFVQPFRGLLRPHVKALVLAIADGVIEAVYARQKLAA